MMDKNKQPLLVIEDSDEDFIALSRMVSKTNIPNLVYRCEDGEEALDFLYHEGEYSDRLSAPRPALIILDLNLPGTDGREVLAALKQDLDLKMIPVVILSTSSNPQDVDTCYRQGISGYLVKPMNITLFSQLVENFINYWFETVELPNIDNI